MRGYVETPSSVVDSMVEKLFLTRPSRSDVVLDPGCGTGVFIEGILRWCNKHRMDVPHVVGIDSDPRHIQKAQEKLAGHPGVSFRNEDFLIPRAEKYDFIIGNPPYVPITELSTGEKERYRSLYRTAIGRFDLYLLFFERALQSLKPRGRLVFITPEKFLYVETAEPLRQLLSEKSVEEIRMLKEDVFGELVTYPTITILRNRVGPCETSLMLRDGRASKVTFPTDGSSWLPYIRGTQQIRNQYKLLDICTRISCGVATGADSVFIFRNELVSKDLEPYAYPTVGGRELKNETGGIGTNYSMLTPYDREGKLLDPGKLGSFMNYLSQSQTRKRLEQRTCVSRKPWYAFHENPPLRDILRPKILCKDITSHPRFWIDVDGRILPRHSVYYLVPKDPSRIEEIADFLNSREAIEWLKDHCQRAANGFLRVQSHVLKQMPIPERLVKKLITVAN